VTAGGRIRRTADAVVDRVRRRLDAYAHGRGAGALANAPLAPPERYRERWRTAQAQAYPEVDAFEQRAGAAIDRDWLEPLALLTQVTIKASPPCYQHGRLLYAALARYAKSHPGEPLTIVETGTARGYSSLCLAKALDDRRADGRIFTIDVLPHERSMCCISIRDSEGPTTRRDLLSPYAALRDRYVVFIEG
jgi:hypothetical protein